MHLHLIAIVIAAVGVMLVAWMALRHANVSKHDTTIRELKVRVQDEIKQACAAAQRGDPCAALKLEALKETLTEQSVRLTGHAKPPSTVILPPDAMRQQL